MGKTVTVWALLLCLLLTACGGEEPQGFFEEASGIPEEAVLLTVDGREIPAWRYLYWLARTCDYLQDRYQAAGLTLDWSAPLEGGTLADYAKDQALANTALYAAVENQAEEAGIRLTEADLASLSAAWEEQAASAGGETEYLASLAALGLDRVRSEELSGTGRLYAKLYARFQETAAAETSGDGGQGPLTVDRILIRAGTDRDAARAQAAEVFSQLNQAEDKAAVFSDLAAQWDDNAGPRAVSGGLESSLAEAAASLEIGQCSGILESDEGFSILLRCEAVPADRTAEQFDQTLRQAAENAAVQTSAAYDQLDAAAFSAGLRRARKAL